MCKFTGNHLGSALWNWFGACPALRSSHCCRTLHCLRERPCFWLSFHHLSTGYVLSPAEASRDLASPASLELMQMRCVESRYVQSTSKKICMQVVLWAPFVRYPLGTELRMASRCTSEASLFFNMTGLDAWPVRVTAQRVISVWGSLLIYILCSGLIMV